MNLNDLRKIKHQIGNLKRKHGLRCDDYIKEHCPHKVGGLIEVIGYSHTGKTMMIESVEMIVGWRFRPETPWEYSFKYSGYLLKINGDVGELFTSFKVKIEET